jgi:hypothetical protein
MVLRQERGVYAGHPHGDDRTVVLSRTLRPSRCRLRRAGTAGYVRLMPRWARLTPVDSWDVMDGQRGATMRVRVTAGSAKARGAACPVPVPADGPVWKRHSATAGVASGCTDSFASAWRCIRSEPCAVAGAIDTRWGDAGEPE